MRQHEKTVLKLKFHRIFTDRIQADSGLSREICSKIAYDTMKLMSPKDKRELISKEYLSKFK